MKERRLQEPQAPSERLGETGRNGTLLVRCLFFAGMVLAYVIIAALVVFFVSRNGKYPSGSDTMFYVYRGDFLYRSITREGNWYPLLDMAWYNGVQTWRYWSPLSALILAGCQAVMGGSSFDGYLLFVGLFYVLNGLTWLLIGYTHKRPYMGGLLGLLWFFVPCNLFMFFAEGVLARAMSMAVLPWFLVCVYDYFYGPAQRRFPPLVGMVVSMIFIIMFHVGWAGMLVISLLLFLLFYFLTTRKKADRVSVGPVLICVLLAFLITGIWLYPSLKGGITGIDSSQVMRNHFQSLLKTLNPFGGWSVDGHWNRWDNPSTNQDPYFGPAAFCLCLFGLLFARRKAAAGFMTAILICLLTSSAAYPLLVLLPGASYLWMLRFIAIALTFVFVSLFFWTTLKRPYQTVAIVLLCAEAMLSFSIFLGNGSATSPEERFAQKAQVGMIPEAQALTTQRASIVEPGSSVADGVYCLAGFGEARKPTSYGQGVQAAVTYTNIVQINQAAEDGQFLYMFDRLLELGNDTVVVPVGYLDGQPFGIDELDAAAEQVGYHLAATSDACRMYRLNAPDTFGVVSKYRAIAIGTGSNSIALGFPAVEETQNIWLDEYTFDQLKDYDVIYLAGFTYHDLSTAERLVTDLSEAGTRVIIMADGIPADEHTGSKSFLGVSCNTVNFQNGYPALDTVIGTLYCDLFPEGYTKDWKTVYLNGLTDVWGTITDVPEGRMDFFGTGPNDNVIYIGLALTYHYSLTLDPAVGELLSLALDLSPQELPRRELVPLNVDYHDNVITVDSPRDNVNTTLAFHDIFRSDRELRVVNNLTVVDEGVTTIRLVYPYLLVGGVMSGLGLVLCVGYLVLMKKRLKKLAQVDAEAALEDEPTSPQEDASEDAPKEP